MGNWKINDYELKISHSGSDESLITSKGVLGLFNTHNSKKYEFIWHVNNTTEYLKHFPLFGTDKGLPIDINIWYHKVFNATRLSETDTWAGIWISGQDSQQACRVLRVTQNGWGDLPW